MSKHYWGTEMDQVVQSYNRTRSISIKNKLFETFIHPRMSKLIECIFNRYFHDSVFDDTPKNIQFQTISHLVSNIGSYNPKKGKSYSYFGTIAKRFLIEKQNTINRIHKKEISIVTINSDGETIPIIDIIDIEPTYLTGIDHRRLDFSSKVFSEMIDFYKTYTPSVWLTSWKKYMKVLKAIDDVIKDTKSYDEFRCADKFGRKTIYSQIKKKCNLGPNVSGGEIGHMIRKLFVIFMRKTHKNYRAYTTPKTLYKNSG